MGKSDDMATNNQPVITIQLHCQALPGAAFAGRENVRLGIQRGKMVVDDVSAAVDAVTFACQLRVERNAETGKPNFLGPYAQGKPAERFLYLCWGERRAEAWDGIGRVKIHLSALSWAAVATAIAGGTPIEALITMTDATGKPIYASVRKENITWQVDEP